MWPCLLTAGVRGAHHDSSLITTSALRGPVSAVAEFECAFNAKGRDAKTLEGRPLPLHTFGSLCADVAQEKRYHLDQGCQASAAGQSPAASLDPIL